MPFPSDDLFPSDDFFPGASGNPPRVIPKLKVPIDFNDTSFGTVEQDSVNEIAQCVYAVLATERGSRIEEPTFGISDPTFEQGGMDLGEAANAVATWEPRASVELTQTVADAIADVEVEVERR